MFGPPKIRLPLAKPFHKTASDADVGRPDRRLTIARPVLVCAECDEEIQRVGEDALFWCEGCQQLEGDVKEQDDTDDAG